VIRIIVIGVEQRRVAVLRRILKKQTIHGLQQLVAEILESDMYRLRRFAWRFAISSAGQCPCRICPQAQSQAGPVPRSKKVIVIAADSEPADATLPGIIEALQWRRKN